MKNRSGILHVTVRWGRDSESLTNDEEGLYVRSSHMSGWLGGGMAPEEQEDLILLLIPRQLFASTHARENRKLELH